MAEIWVNGVSSKSVGLYVDALPLVPSAKRKYTSYNTDIESVMYPEKYYEDISLTITSFLINGEKTIDAVYAWLNNAETLQLSNREDIFLKIKSVLPITPKKKGCKANQLDLKFTCGPFKISVDSPEITISSGDVVTNSGTLFAQPIYTIVGNGTVNLIVNGETLTINNLSGGEFVIDTQRMIAYEGTTIKLNQTIGKLPFLAVGNNVISWDGDVSSLKIIKNERWL